MDTVSIDTMARQAAPSTTRRFSLRTMAATGLTALAAPLAARARYKRQADKYKNKTKNEQNAR